MAIDQGTTGTRAILFDQRGQIICDAYQEIRQFYPRPGWVEHDAQEYWQSTLNCTREVLSQSGAEPRSIVGIGITNQRETTILWDKITGEPVFHAITWQCRRTVPICKELKRKGLENRIRETTGLFIDPCFSGTKIKWIIDNVRGIKKKIKEGRILAGCVDSWLIWKLTGGRVHVTDYSNASRTMLFDVNKLEWDLELLGLLGIPPEVMPKARPSSSIFGYTDKNVLFGVQAPVAGVAGDAQAALFGQTCFEPGMTKNTYGTGLSLMMNIGDKFSLSKNGLTTALAWENNGKICYALEGLVLNGGSAVQWLRDGLGVLERSSQSGVVSESIPNTGGVYLVPAFTGLCAPYWDANARGIIVGITRGTTREHIVRAALESIAYQTKDVLDAMMCDSQTKPKSLAVDGGASANDFLMQFQADILDIPVERPVVLEVAALGVAYITGLTMNFWHGKEEIRKTRVIGRVFEPEMSKDKRDELYHGWKRAVKRSLQWVEE